MIHKNKTKIRRKGRQEKILDEAIQEGEKSNANKALVWPFILAVPGVQEYPRHRVDSRAPLRSQRGSEGNKGDS